MANVYKLSPGRMSFPRNRMGMELDANVVPEKTEAKFFAATPRAAEINIMSKPSLAVKYQKVNPVFRPENIRLIDPVIAKKISEIKPQTEGIPREKITVPISPIEQVNDEVLFEEAMDANKKLYLSRYRIANEEVSGKIQYRVSLEGQVQGWNLIIYLEKYPSPKIEIQSREAQEIDKTVAVILKYQLKESGGVEKELYFQEVSTEPAGLRAVLHIGNLEERDELFRALTKLDYHTVLIIRRVIRVGIPVSVPVSVSVPIAPPMRRRPIREDIDPSELPPVFKGRHRFQVIEQFDQLDAIVPQRKPSFVAMRTERTLAEEDTSVMTPPIVAVPAPPLFREVTRSLDNILENFIFEPQLHGYIFKGIEPATEETPGLIPFSVDYNQIPYNYYQERARRHVFYYLPDNFKIARRPESPHTPIISIQFPSKDETVLKYFALPYVDPDRLKAAAEKLKDVTPEIEFQPLPKTDKIQFELILPASPDPAKHIYLISSRSGIAGELHLTIDEFQKVFNAMFGGPENILFQGQIKIEVFKDKIETIDFIARMNDMAGDLIDYKEAQDGSGVNATFKNAIESPLRINSLDADLQSGSLSKAQIVGLSLPVSLNPGEGVQFAVMPSPPSTLQGEVHAIFNMEGVQVLPDPNAIWDCIIEKNLSSAPKTIVANTYIFKSPEASKDIIALIVDFKTGESVELNEKTDTTQVTLNLPVKDRILGLANTGAYSYRVTVIHKDVTEYTGPWKTETTDKLRINEEDWNVSAGTP